MNVLLFRSLRVGMLVLAVLSSSSISVAAIIYRLVPYETEFGLRLLGGTITTDGTYGPLQQEGIVDWSIDFGTTAGVMTFTPDNCSLTLENDAPAGKESLVATETGISASAGEDYLLSFRDGLTSIGWSQIESPVITIRDFSFLWITSRAPLALGPNNVAVIVPEPTSGGIALLAAIPVAMSRFRRD